MQHAALLPGPALCKVALDHSRPSILCAGELLPGSSQEAESSQIDAATGRRSTEVKPGKLCEGGISFRKDEATLSSMWGADGLQPSVPPEDNPLVSYHQIIHQAGAISCQPA